MTEIVANDDILILNVPWVIKTPNSLLGFEPYINVNGIMRARWVILKHNGPLAVFFAS